MSEWIKNSPVSCGTMFRQRWNVVECQCPKCKRWCLKWQEVFDYDYCPNCGEYMRENKDEPR